MSPFTIRDRVEGSQTLLGQKVYAFSLDVPQVPSKPLKIVTEFLLLRNDRAGDLWLYGYLVGKAVRTVKPAKLVSDATPSRYQTFDYTGPNGRRIARIFYGIEPTNPTPLGVFTVADYEESAATHDYGYARGKGIAEEDHGPDFEVDCLIESIRLR